MFTLQKWEVYAWWNDPEKWFKLPIWNPCSFFPYVLIYLFHLLEQFFFEQKLLNWDKWLPRYVIHCTITFVYIYSCQLKAVVYSNKFFDVFQFATISYPTISFHSIIILGSGSHLGSVCIKINTKSIISLKRRKKSIPIKLTLSQKWNLKRKQNKKFQAPKIRVVRYYLTLSLSNTL